LLNCLLSQRKMNRKTGSIEPNIQRTISQKRGIMRVPTRCREKGPHSALVVRDCRG